MPLAAVITVIAGFLGLAVLFALGWRLFQQVRSLARVVGSSSERIAQASGSPLDPSESGAAPNTW